MTDKNDETILEADELFSKLAGDTRIEEYDILIVDDIHANVFLIESIVSEEYSVRSVNSAADMWQLMEQQPPKLLLLDIMMPYENGFQVLEKMQAHKKLREIPVIVVSAKDAKEDVVKALQLGAADYIAKPVTEEVLRAKVVRFLGEKDR